MEQSSRYSVKALGACCAEARKYLGATSPNPAVGAAAVDASGKILAIAAHTKAGEDHAEAALLKICKAQNLFPQIHTLYVTLEPCNHQGRTPPCTDAIIAAGIKRIVIGTADPNPAVKGGGADRLREAGIDVTLMGDEECKQLIHAFAFHAQSGQPWVTIKRAFDKSGSMIPPSGQKTFASKESLVLAHRLRKKADAIITGSGTVLADHPLFTVRHVKDHPGKRRLLAILDRRKRVPDDYLIAAKNRGLDAALYDDIRKAINDLAAKGARDILIEAGPALSDAMLASPFWAMSVNIRAAGTDQVEALFNPRLPIPFDTEQFRWDYFLPA